MPKRRRRSKPAYVYTLNLTNGRKYVGMSNNVERRYGQHCRGTGARWTAKYRPTGISSVKKYSSRSSALRGEKRQYNAMKKKHGKHLVRGANHCSTWEPKCYTCGSHKHISNRCPCRRRRRR